VPGLSNEGNPRLAILLERLSKMGDVYVWDVGGWRDLGFSKPVQMMWIVDEGDAIKRFLPGIR
jgi:hypothetical protein